MSGDDGIRGALESVLGGLLEGVLESVRVCSQGVLFECIGDYEQGCC